MPKHSLDPLLKPDSIALIGASEKAGTPGHVLTGLILNSNFSGRVYLVNPGYETLYENVCYPDLNALPETVEHVVLSVANEGLEQALGNSIVHGAKAATIFSSCYLDNDTQPPLKERLYTIASQAGMVICGGNGMGFYNLLIDLYIGIFPVPAPVSRGGISYIAQSGSAFTALAHNGSRLKFNLCVSSGNEMLTHVADYMDWSLAQPETRVIALFIETVRHPQAFVAALEKAVDRDIPVVVLKIGRSPLGAKMALTHTGAVAGDQAAYEALFKRYGVIEVSDFDEMAATLKLFQSGRRANCGALATIQESGGLRELVVDIAHDLDIEFASIESSTAERIKGHLEPGLKAENPLDAWGSHDRFESRFLACMGHLMDDPNVAAGIFFSNFRDGYYLSEAFLRIMQKIAKRTNKPIAMANCYSDIAHDDFCKVTNQSDIVFIDGTREALLAIKHLFAYRDFRQQQYIRQPAVTIDRHRIAAWRTKLTQRANATLGEAEAMAMLNDCSIPVPKHFPICNEEDLIACAHQIGYPLALKTAATGINHKSDAAGVFINIQNQNELTAHYHDLSNRLGPDALISQMVDKGTEVGIGIINDSQFGPFIMIAAGGILIELLAERRVALAPVSYEETDAMLAELKINHLINGVRGRAAENRQALIDIIVKLSVLAYELRDCIEEVDLNPIIVNQTSALVVDALIIAKA